jgi:MFS family permease
MDVKTADPSPSPGVAQATAPWPTPRAARYAVFLFSLAIMINFLDRGILNLLVQPIKRDLGLSDTQMGMIVGFAFVLFYVAVGFPIARWVDRGTRKFIIATGVGLFGLMTALCGLSRSFWQLFACRIGVGVGEACIGPSFASMLSDFYPKEKLARAIAFCNFGYVAGVGLSLVVGGAIIGALQNYSVIDVPLLGQMRPWQVVFLICGLPGLLVAMLLLTLKEPPRRGTMILEGTARGFTMAESMRFMLERWQLYGPIFVGIGLRSIMLYASMTWMPAFFERVHGWPAARYGLIAGVVTLIATPLGLLLGPWIAERWFRRGQHDANMRVTVWVCAISAPFQVAATLMPTPELSMMCHGIATFINAGAVGPENAALQVVTPNQMRGQVVAVNMFMFNVIGAGLGPILAGVLTDHVFGSEMLVGWSLASVALVAGPLSGLVFWYGMRPYGRAYQQLEAATAAPVQGSP